MSKPRTLVQYYPQLSITMDYESYNRQQSDNFDETELEHENSVDVLMNRLDGVKRKLSPEKVYLDVVMLDEGIEIRFFSYKKETEEERIARDERDARLEAERNKARALKNAKKMETLKTLAHELGVKLQETPSDQ